MPIEKITCVQFDGEFPDFCYRLIMPDYGMPLIGTMLAHAGYDVRIYLEHIQPAEPARIADSDLLCLSTLNAGADKTFRFARDVRQRGRAFAGVLPAGPPRHPDRHRRHAGDVLPRGMPRALRLRRPGRG